MSDERPERKKEGLKIKKVANLVEKETSQEEGSTQGVKKDPSDTVKTEKIQPTLPKENERIIEEVDRGKVEPRIQEKRMNTSKQINFENQQSMDSSTTKHISSSARTSTNGGAKRPRIILPNKNKESDSTILNSKSESTTTKLKNVDCSKINPNAHYIFTFGEFGSGKTSVNGIISLVLSRMYRTITDPIGNPEGVDLMNAIQSDLEKGKFPTESERNKVVEYVLSVEVEDQMINLVFVEMSGEDLEKIVKKGDEKKLGKHIEPYFLCPGASVTYLLVADYERVMGEGDTQIRHPDYFFHTFLSYIERLEDPRGNKITVDRLILILSKFDMKKNSDVNLQTIVKEHLPKTYLALRSSKIKKAMAFPFSVGEVGMDQNNQNYIKTLDLSGPVEDVTQYMVDLFVKKKEPSTWSKMVGYISNFFN